MIYITNVEWKSKALDDLKRLQAFLAPVNKSVAYRIIQLLRTTAKQLPDHPFIGEKIEEFISIDVHRIFVGDYEMHYEIHDSIIYILRIWHTREDR